MEAGPGEEVTWWTELTMPQAVLVLGLVWAWLVFVLARAVGESAAPELTERAREVAEYEAEWRRADLER